ncbi:CDP-alcohol phosphatidyltransferase family protein [Nocardiopsis alba]|uniref:CDP-alcohol phosphatidyltransferase family protein n=1 Tax=Nocardiopsis alba (strain ATCC BAA-2165 / BE74) TaxID=1205910 RepID=J7L618_NOCAA|nr:CDP-alcohol phosphatidyltransferase family protein [Nocardiopsis alba]AFR08146.1 CDP-alcohol phosphatidyltransferase family protein [Nocardiopsis alba ATCC BAA-2165]
MSDPALRQVVAALCGQAALLAVLTAAPGLGPWGWTVGALYALSAVGLLMAAMRRHRRWPLGPADLVTLTRIVLIGGVTALVVDGGPAWALVTLAVPALALDLVDGLVARRTGTASAFGARFDMEADAFLILVLSVRVASFLGPWVLVIGAMRYLFGVASWAAPWLRGPLPPSRARKAVAAAQGIVLTAVASGALPEPVSVVVVAMAAAALSWSFGRDVVGLWRERSHRTVPVGRS